jgi:GT2 family glycosyltransferase
MVSKDVNILAILVNFESATLTLDAVQSVLNSAFSGLIRLVVVDNSEREDEAVWLRTHLPPSVELVVNPSNVGFGRACNQVFEKDQSEAVLLINPDARVLPGCLKNLRKTLFSTRKTGAVGPQLFWDESLEYYFPPPCSPALLEFRALLSGGSAYGIGTILNILWRRYAIRTRKSKNPVRVRNLSGGLVLLKRQAVLDAGGLFDPRFFLYYEDTDLFFRLRKSGYDLLMDPSAKAVHYYDQCGKDDQEKKRTFMLESMAVFYRKHPNFWNRPLLRAMLHALKPARKPVLHWTAPFSVPFTLKVPNGCRKQWLFEWSPNPDFMPAALRFGSGPNMAFGEKHWNMLAPGRYFGRMGGTKWFDRFFLRVTWEVK